MTGTIIRIGKEEYELKYTINTLCDMTRAGIDVMNLESIIFDLPTIRDFVYFGLKGANKKITQNKAGALMDDYIQEDHELGDILELVMEALAAALGSKEETVEEVKDEDPDAK